jgi:hypothetical protein
MKHYLLRNRQIISDHETSDSTEIPQVDDVKPLSK